MSTNADGPTNKIRAINPIGFDGTKQLTFTLTQSTLRNLKRRLPWHATVLFSISIQIFDDLDRFQLDLLHIRSIFGWTQTSNVIFIGWWNEKYPLSERIFYTIENMWAISQCIWNSSCKKRGHIEKLKRSKNITVLNYSCIKWSWKSTSIFKNSIC